MTQRIEIIVSPQGQSTLQTKGFSGASCREASKWLELALGQPQKETLTSEFHQSVHTEQTQQAGGTS